MREVERQKLSATPRALCMKCEKVLKQKPTFVVESQIAKGLNTNSSVFNYLKGARVMKNCKFEEIDISLPNPRAWSHLFFYKG